MDFLCEKKPGKPGENPPVRAGGHKPSKVLMSKFKPLSQMDQPKIKIIGYIKYGPMKMNTKT